MKIFISWSGKRSKKVSEKLRQWLPNIIPAVKPWASHSDIEAGLRWSNSLQQELSNTRFGIICCTEENLNSPWILFEAGAIAKTLDDTYVCPYLIDFEPIALPGPLKQFQAKQANKNGTWELIKTINKALKVNSVDETKLERIFKKHWPDLEFALNSLPLVESKEPIDQEIVRNVRKNAENSRKRLTSVLGPVERRLTDTPSEQVKFLTNELGQALTLLELAGANLTAEDYVNRAVDLYYKGLGEGALEKLEVALKLDPNLAIAWNTKSYILITLERYTESLEAADAAIRNNPEAANAWDNRGSSLLKLKRTDEALAAFEKARELDPTADEPLYNLACLFATKGDKERALSCLAEAIQRVPKNGEYAIKDPDFDTLKNDDKFINLTSTK